VQTGEEWVEISKNQQNSYKFTGNLQAIALLHSA